MRYLIYLWETYFGPHWQIVSSGISHFSILNEKKKQLVGTRGHIRFWFPIWYLVSSDLVCATPIHLSVVINHLLLLLLPSTSFHFSQLPAKLLIFSCQSNFHFFHSFNSSMKISMEGKGIHGYDIILLKLSKHPLGLCTSDKFMFSLDRNYYHYF